MMPLHVDSSAFSRDTTAPENLSYINACPESEPVQMYSSLRPAYFAHYSKQKRNVNDHESNLLMQLYDAIPTFRNVNR